MAGVALALGSSLCWGVADFVGGIQSRRFQLLAVLLISQLAALVGLVAFLALRGQAPPHLLRLIPAAVGGIAGLAGLAAFYRALAIGTMSIVAPIAATSVVVPVAVGVASGERPGAAQVVGLIAATAGVILASREQSSSAEARAQTRASVMLALVAAAGFGSFFVGLRYSAKADVPWALLSARAADVAVLIALAVARRPAFLGTRGALAALTITGLLDLAANGLFALATRHGLLSVVSVAASLYPLVTIALARALLGERVRRIQEVGIASAVLGVALIAAG